MQQPGQGIPPKRDRDLMPLTHRSVPFFFTPGPAFFGAGPSGKEQRVTGRGSLFYFSRLHTAALRSNRQCGGSCLWVGPPRPILHPRSRCRRAASYGGSSVCTGPPQLYDRGVYTSRKSQGQKLTCTAPPGGSGARNGHERPARCPQTASLHGRGRRGSGGCNGSR